MQSPPQTRAPERIRFEAFEVDTHTEELFRAGRKVRVPQQSFRLLSMLLERPGQLVTREVLRGRLWPAGTLIEYDQGLNTAVNRLREALGDSAESPRYIETLPKRGYRFIATIQPRLPDTLQPALPAPDRQSAVGTNGTARVDVTALPDLTSGGESRLAPSASGGTAGAGIGRTGGSSRRKTVLAVAAALVITLVTAGVVFRATHHSVPRPTSGREVIPFTSLPGQEIAPTFSPDGSQIAFGWNGGADAGRHFDLYVKSLGSERLLRLTNQPSNWITPAWSPDGSRIAFVRQTDEGAALLVIPALGGSERRLVSQAVTVGSSIQISWSPDGRQLAYAGYGPSGAAQVYLVSLESLQTRPLAPAPQCQEAGEPAFSPDGRQLALVCYSTSAVYSIYTVQLPGGPLRQVASMLGYPQGIAWAADGERLVFANDPGDGGELWQVSAGGELMQLPFGEEASAPVVATRSGRIAYVRGRGTLDIWRADLTAPHPEDSATRLIFSTRTQTVARYSPDGKRIAFQSNRSGSTEIWLADADGGDAERLTSFNGPHTSAPSWCSDGRRLAFDSRASGLSGVYIEDIAERVPRRVVTSRDNLSTPAWSQDCKWLFASDAGSVLYRLPSSGGTAERFTAQPSNYAVVVGDRVIFNALRSDGLVLGSKPVEGGAEVALQNMPRLSYSDAWVATVAGIYYTDALAKPITVNFYDFTTRARRTLMTLKQASSPAGPGLAVSPDGRRLLYSQIENEHSEIMLGPAP